MYRFAPDRADAGWRWLIVGSVLATIVWLIATLCFGFYASLFGVYNATDGSLGAVGVLLWWLYVSAYAILLGGLVNAEAERQTARDTTTGPEEPMGKRGAVVADTSAAIKPPEEQRAEKDAAINGDDPSSQDRVSRCWKQGLSLPSIFPGDRKRTRLNS